MVDVKSDGDMDSDHATSQVVLSHFFSSIFASGRVSETKSHNHQVACSLYEKFFWSCLQHGIHTKCTG